MKKYILVILFAVLFSISAIADQYKICQGKITAVDDVLNGYAGVSGGLLLVSVNSTACPGWQFWYEDDDAKTSNLLSMSLMSLASDKTVSIVYDEQSALYGSKGKIMRITVHN